MSKIKLPDNPADLIRLAVLDLLDVREMREKYQIDMGTWHDSLDASYGYKCAVCFAGCVMANTLKVSPDEDSDPWSFTDTINAKLFALDFFRRGKIVDGIKEMGIEAPAGIDYYIKVVGYEDDPELFVIDMLDMAYEIDKAMGT